jgi:general secretion pathway protein D
MEKTSKNRVTNTAAMLMAAASVMPLVVTVANAGETGGAGETVGQVPGQSALAQREIIRRQQDSREADEFFISGRKAYAEKNYEKAVADYNRAINKLPDAPLTEDRRKAYIQHLVDASVALAGEYAKVGNYPGARDLLDGVLSPGMDPDSEMAKQALAELDDPIRNNPALTPGHVANVDEVRRALYMGEGYYNLGKFDDAKREFEKVLRIDQHNTAARRWMEKVATVKADYYRAAYDQMRAELLMEVDRAWELAVPLETPVVAQETAQPMDTSGTSYILNKLRTIIIPRIDFENTTLEEAIDFLRQRSVELDTVEQNPERRGISFVIRKPRAAAGAGAGLEETGLPGAALGGDTGPGSIIIPELKLNNVPLATALKYITDETKMRYRVDDFAVTLVPATEPDEDLFNRSFRVPPDFTSSLEAGSTGTPEAAPDPFDPTPAGGGQLKPRVPVQDLLAQRGVTFPPGSSATFVASSSTLVVRNTPTNIDFIEQIVESTVDQVPKQIRILTKFIEISQENNDELGFDWVITPFSLGADSFLGGGSVGNQVDLTNADFSNVPGFNPLLSNQSRPVTAGTRSGDYAIGRNNIDALLNNPDRSSQQPRLAPGILSLTGLFNEGQVQVIMRGLAQKKGADVMNAPSVLARSGQKATIEIIREFIYPTEYDPPELPNQVGGGFGGGGGGGILDPDGLGQAPQGFPVTPANPTAWETRNVGVLLEIEPTIGATDYVIDLRFAPEIVEFEGFINYGSPILAPGSDALGNPVSVTITENRIEMPVFSTRKVNTALSIYDGHTVSVGGLMREDVQKVEDRVPILGDIPIIGRLFQSNAENRIKSNLIVFVTAQIIDATGRPLRASGSADLLSTVAGGGVAPIEQPPLIEAGGVLPLPVR